MKYYKTLKVYKMSNVKYIEDSKTAWSYDWWCFYKNGIFNNVNYSNTTSKHQSKIRTLLGEINEPIKLILRYTLLSLSYACRNNRVHGINEALKNEVEIALNEIKLINEEIKKPKTHKKKNNERKAKIIEIKKHIKKVKSLIKEKAV